MWNPEKRDSFGLQGVFKTVFPIKDFYETASLEFVNYRLTEPKYDVEECLLRGMTFAAPIKVTVRLVVWDVNAETEARKHQGGQGAGGLFRRDPPDDRQRDLYHQRDGTGDREPAPPVSRVSFSIRIRSNPTPGERSSIMPASSPIAGHGSISNSTRRISSMSGSTGVGRSRSPSSSGH